VSDPVVRKLRCWTNVQMCPSQCNAVFIKRRTNSFELWCSLGCAWYHASFDENRVPTTLGVLTLACLFVAAGQPHPLRRHDTHAGALQVISSPAGMARLGAVPEITPGLYQLVAVKAEDQDHSFVRHPPHRRSHRNLLCSEINFGCSAERDAFLSALPAGYLVCLRI
jgi:hypothetical protein